ncbi:MAG: amino acid adenylation domain-containing protein [Xanthobacteraceae bacterium]
MTCATQVERDRAALPHLPSGRLHEVFAAHAAATPHRIAVTAPGAEITYGELDRRANHLANRLRVMGVGPETRVGIYLNRGIDLIVSILGVLKAGGAYVPVDPTYPAKRVQLMLDDSAVGIIVTTSQLAHTLHKGTSTRLCLDTDEQITNAEDTPPAAIDGDNTHLAYVIYTSGTTGVPKAVAIEHRNVIRLFEQTQPWFGFSADDVWTLFHSVGFDFSVWEIWGALLYGGRLVIVPFETARMPARFLSLLVAEGVTVLNQTPSAFRSLLAEVTAANTPRPSLSLRLVIFGGEALDLRMLIPWVDIFGDQRPALVNMYGITEITVHATYKQIRRGDLRDSIGSPIGVPIPDLQILLLDADGQPVADGEPGEIYIAGPGVARGYLEHQNPKNPTPARFQLRSMLGEPPRLWYRSGDLAVRTPDGELFYLGRCDGQFKLRGYRVEPREIEICLMNDLRLGACTVAPYDYGDGDARLVAYVVPAPGVVWSSVLEEDLKRIALAELPPHMRPSVYLAMSVLPLNIHGKVDRTALPPPPIEAPIRTADKAKLTSTEAQIHEIWQQILVCGEIGCQDDFFDVGGTSLTLIRVLGRVVEVFKTDFDEAVLALADGVTIAGLARHVDDKMRRSYDAN